MYRATLRRTFVVLRFTILALGLGLLSTGQRAEAVKPPPEADAAPVVAANNRFAFELLGRVSKPDANAFVSPYSIASALSMTYAGARGDTAAEMARTLHFDTDQGRWHPAFAALNAQLQPDEKKRDYQLYIANRLWAQSGAPFNAAFLKTTRDNYAAGIQAVDFRNDSEAARQTINTWIEERTDEKVKALIRKGQLTDDTRVVLTNAIYFKAGWDLPFTKEATALADFRTDGEILKVPMMRAMKFFAYSGSEKFEVVSLPYKDGGLSMLIVLPKKLDGLADVEKDFNAERLKEVTAKLASRRVDLHLPKFKLQQSYNLQSTLVAMGMPKAFSRKEANFSGITREPLFLENVIHQAVLEVDEKGAEAAAATVVRPPLKFKPPPEEEEKTVVFKADHPFLFMIRENRTGAVLFLGRLVKPEVK